MTTRGGARRGAGRKAKRLVELAERGTFSTARHGKLLWSDDSLLIAASERPDDEYVQRLAVIQRLARERGRGRHDVEWFARIIREEMKEREPKAEVAESSHAIEVTEEYRDGVLHVEARTGAARVPAVRMQLLASEICPHCLGAVLRGVLERFEADAAGRGG
jgi:hypothetical protein